MKIVVLDRDGVINHDSDDYIKSAEEFLPIEGSIEAIANLTRAGFKVVVASNQSGIARKYFDEETLAEIHHKMCSLVESAGGLIEGIFYCPHLPNENCDCRKPKTGLLQQIEHEFSCGLAGSYFVGDSYKDVQAALAFHCKPVLVRTGKGIVTENTISQEPSLNVPVFDNLAAVVSQLLVISNDQ